MSLIEQLIKLVEGFTLKRAFSLITILVIGFFAIYSFEKYSGFLSLYRLDKATALLERINAVDRAGIPNSSLLEARNSAVAELKRILSPYEQEVVQLATINSPDQQRSRVGLLKFIFGALPWFIISLTALPRIFRKEQSAWAGFWGIQIFSVSFGIVCVFVPSLGTWWLDYLVLPWALLIFIGIIPVSISKANSGRRNREKSQKILIINQLRMLAAATEQYRLEHLKDPHSLSDLIGDDKYIKQLSNVDGESYDECSLKQGDPFIARLRGGELLTYSP